MHAPSGSITFAPNAETRQKICLTPGIKRVSKVISRRDASPPRIHLCSCIHRGTHSNLIPENPYKSSPSQNASGFCEVLTRVYLQTTSRSVQPFWQLDRVPNTVTTTLRATRVGNDRIYRAYDLRAGGSAKKSFAAAICQR